MSNTIHSGAVYCYQMRNEPKKGVYRVVLLLINSTNSLTIIRNCEAALFCFAYCALQLSVHYMWKKGKDRPFNYSVPFNPPICMAY